MKKLQSFSFHLHWITMCCFLLPFFYDSCSKTSNDADDSVSAVISADSVVVRKSVSDTLRAILKDTTHTSESTNDELLSETIIKKYPIFKLILQPAAGTQTGLYLILDTVPFLPLFATTTAFTLLLIGFLGKWIDKNTLKIFLVLDSFAAAFLFISGPHLLFDYETLWGYWLSIICTSALLCIDAYIIFKQKEQASY